MAQPTVTIPTRTLEETCVVIAGVEHRARVGNGQVVVAAHACSWARPQGEQVEITVGARVPEMLERAVDPPDREQSLAAAVLIAGVVGHPRQDPAGKPVRFVWTDHVALGAGREAALAMRHTWVDAPQAEHIRAISGRVQVVRSD